MRLVSRKALSWGTYLALGLLAIITAIGLVNTIMGVDSPLRAWLPEGANRLGDVLFSLAGPDKAEESVPPAGKSDLAAQQFDQSYGVPGHSHAYPSDAGVGACVLARAIPNDTGPDVAIYSWVDEKGVTSFSDEPPDDRISSVEVLRGGHPEFKADITAEGIHISNTVKGQINAGAKRIYEQWGEWLGYGALRRSHVNIRIVSDWRRFASIWGRPDPPAGFYRHRSNEAVLFYNPAAMSPERLVALAFHEVSHLILAWQVGGAPPWFNEGLAEYFETMTVSGQSGSFRLNPVSIQIAAAKGRVPVPSLLRKTPDQWYGPDRVRNYASGGLLIAFLQSSDSGRRLLKDLAQQLHEFPCAATRGTRKLDIGKYPGGEAALNRDWGRWLRSVTARRA